MNEQPRDDGDPTPANGPAENRWKRAGVVVMAAGVLVTAVGIGWQMCAQVPRADSDPYEELRKRLREAPERNLTLDEREEAYVERQLYHRIVLNSGSALRIPSTVERQTLSVGTLELYSGASILAGGSGGGPGADGASGTRGSKCTDGTAGLRGERGFDGANGITLDLTVLEVVLHDYAEGGESARRGFLHIDTSGGPGGAGGTGGSGGSGGRGDRSERCDGGNGGQGGEGGDGGRGGNGGDLLLTIAKVSLESGGAPSDLNDWLTHKHSGGDGGIAGEGGSGGSGGRGQGANIFGVSADAGSRGNQGQPGKRGQSGRAGRSLLGDDETQLDG